MPALEDKRENISLTKVRSDSSVARLNRGVTEVSQLGQTVVQPKKTQENEQGRLIA